MYVLFVTLFTTRIEFRRGMADFFPSAGSSRGTVGMFRGLGVGSGVVVVLSNGSNITSTSSLVRTTRAVGRSLRRRTRKALVGRVFSGTSRGLVGDIKSFICSGLPLFLSSRTCRQLSALLATKGVTTLVRGGCSGLVSPTKFTLGGCVVQSPLKLNDRALGRLRSFRLRTGCRLVGRRVFSQSNSALLVFVAPMFGAKDANGGSGLVQLVRGRLRGTRGRRPRLITRCFKNPSMKICGTQRVGGSALIASSVTLVVVVIFVSLMFGRGGSVPLVVAPILFKTLFTLYLVCFVGNNVSTVTMNTNSTMVNVTLDCSVRVLTRRGRMSSMRRLVERVTCPLAMNDFAAVNTFFDLLFADSGLLQSFNLFTSLTLVKAALFYLICLPRFLGKRTRMGRKTILHFVRGLGTCPCRGGGNLMKNVLILAVVYLFASRGIHFGRSVVDLGCRPTRLGRSRGGLTRLFSGGRGAILFIDANGSVKSTAKRCTRAGQLLTRLGRRKGVGSCTSTKRFLVPRRIRRTQLGR